MVYLLLVGLWVGDVWGAASMTGRRGSQAACASRGRGADFLGS